MMSEDDSIRFRRDVRQQNKRQPDFGYGHPHSDTIRESAMAVIMKGAHGPAFNESL
jgi:hypothetical protein